MKDKSNTWGAKAKRTMTAFLPVAKNRRGKCKDCGECCKLPKECFFLRYGKDGRSRCLIWPLVPMNCRKYPRTKEEQLTEKTCGFWFE
jgi:hypothetical protein